MGVMPDWMIRELSHDSKTQLITPFSERVDGKKVISYGLQPAGYDLRLDPRFEVIDWAKNAGAILDPLRPPTADFRFKIEAEDHYIFPPRACIIGWTTERIRVPRNYIVRGVGKQTYSECGVNVVVASVHPGWEGNLRIHIANSSTVPITIYVNMGIVYIEFHKTEEEVEQDYSQLKYPRFQGHGPTGQAA